MEHLTKSEFLLNAQKHMEMMKKDDLVFIYPTDTIYGLGCCANNHKAVEKLRSIKDRHTRPLSVIAPSKDWILENCEIKPSDRYYLDKLPGPYTLILNLKNKNCISPLVNNGMDTLGVRLPDHWITDFVAKLNSPLVTTSANKAGENFMTSLDDLDPRIKVRTSFIVYEGDKNGRPSKVIDLTQEEVEVIHR